MKERKAQLYNKKHRDLLKKIDFQTKAKGGATDDGDSWKKSEPAAKGGDELSEDEVRRESMATA